MKITNNSMGIDQQGWIEAHVIETNQKREKI